MADNNNNNTQNTNKNSNTLMKYNFSQKKQRFKTVKTFKNINMKKLKEQEINDKKNYSNIIERHPNIFSNISKLTPETKENNINDIDQLLEEINIFGEVIKKEIKKEKQLNYHNDIYINDAIILGKKNILIQNITMNIMF